VDVFKRLPLATGRRSWRRPDIADAPTTTAAEIQVLMKHLGRLDAVMSDTADLDLTAIAEKLRRNRLSDAVTSLVKPACRWQSLWKSSSPACPTLVSRGWLRLSWPKGTTNLLLRRMVPTRSSVSNRIRVRRTSLDPSFSGGSWIVTHYFELCDVFER